LKGNSLVEHLGEQMREMGPSTCAWCARYESKHR